MPAPVLLQEGEDTDATRVSPTLWRTRGMLASARGLDAPFRAWLAKGSDAQWNGIEQEVRRRSIARARRYGLSPDDQDDVAGEVFVRLLQLLQSPAARLVRNFDSYVHSIVDNVCRRQIRRIHPAWTRLKEDVVEILRGRRGASGFAVWRTGDHQEMGGYLEWAGGGIRWTQRYLDFQHDDRTLFGHVNQQRHNRNTPLADLLSVCFNWLETPVRVNELTTFLFDYLGMKELPEEISADGIDGDPHPPVDPVNEELVEAIGSAFSTLPRHETAAFLFHLQPEVAERLAWAATEHLNGDGAHEALWEKLGLPAQDLPAVLNECPWCDLKIAEFLGHQDSTVHRTQQRIINLRQRAIRLMRQSIEKIKE